jgi:hypothetical protein
MDKGFYFALGVTILLPFMQWAVPVIPKAIAYAGAAAGTAVMLSEFLGPSIRPPLSSALLFIAAALCAGGAVDLYLQRGKPPEKQHVEQSSPQTRPTFEATNGPVRDVVGIRSGMISDKQIIPYYAARSNC